MRKVLYFCIAVNHMFLLSCSRNTLLSPQALVFQEECLASLEESDYDAARIRCEICLEYDETVPECINGLGLVSFAKNDDVGAIKWFTRAIQMNSSFAQARSNLGAVHFRRGQYEYAINFFLAAIQIDPGYEEARYNAGLCHMKIAEAFVAKENSASALEEIRKAKDQYKKLIALNSSFVNAYKDLASLFSLESNLVPSQGAKNEEAAWYVNECLKLDPKNESCLHILARWNNEK